MPKTLTTAVAVATAISAETVVTASDTVSYFASAGGNEGLEVSGYVNITAGTGTTAVVVRIRRGNGLGGVVVGISNTHTLAAGATASIPIHAQDAVPITTPVVTPTGADSAPENQYTLTVAQTGGTGAGTVNYATLSIEPVGTGW